MTGIVALSTSPAGSRAPAGSANGVRVLRHETNRALEEATELYRRAGFAEGAPFNDEPYANHWFEKALS